MIDKLDTALTWIFATRLAKWVAVHILHIPPEKCSMCYTRVRFAQFMLWLTGKSRTGWLRDKRVMWQVRAHPIPDGFKLSQLTAVAGAELPPLPETIAACAEVDAMYGDEPKPHSWWPRTSQEEYEHQHRQAVKQLSAEW